MPFMHASSARSKRILILKGLLGFCWHRSRPE